MSGKKKAPPRSFTLTDLRKEPMKVIKASHNGEVIITYRGEPIGALRQWVVKGKGRRLANERREK